MKLDKLIKNIMDKDDAFKSLIESQECKHLFYEVDSHLYRNRCARLSDSLLPFDESTKKMYYVGEKATNKQIYIWIWLDSKNCIAEIEISENSGDKDLDNILEIVTEEEIQIESLS